MYKNISDYSADAVATDWGPAIEAAWDDVRSSGGTIHFDQADTLIESEVVLFPPTSVPVPLLLTGDRGNTITPDCGATDIALTCGSIAGLTVRDLVFIGTGGNTNHVDCENVIKARYCETLAIEDTHFIGLKTAGSMILATEGSHSVYMRNVRCDGPSTPEAFVKTDWGTPVTIDRMVCWDITNYKGGAISKTAHGLQSWIHCEGAQALQGANQHSVLNIRDSNFDEGPIELIYVDGYHKVNIERCSFNIRNFAGTTAIHLKDVTHAVIKHCNVGYATWDRPMIVLENCANVVVIGQTFDGGVYRIEKDSATNLRVIHSTGVTVTEV